MVLKPRPMLTASETSLSARRRAHGGTEESGDRHSRDPATVANGRTGAAHRARRRETRAARDRGSAPSGTERGARAASGSRRDRVAWRSAAAGPHNAGTPGHQSRTRGASKLPSSRRANRSSPLCPPHLRPAAAPRLWHRAPGVPGAASVRVQHVMSRLTGGRDAATTRGARSCWLCSRDEHLNVELFFSVADAQRKLLEWQRDYNEDRPNVPSGVRGPVAVNRGRRRRNPQPRTGQLFGAGPGRSRGDFLNLETVQI